MVVVSVVQVTVLQILPSVLATVFSVLVLVQIIAVQQTSVYVLATVVFVMVLVQNITVWEAMVFVPATVMSVLVLAQHIAAQQVMLYAQIQLHHVAVQEVVQSSIVLHVLLIHMVYADIQYVVVILVVKHMTTALRARPAKPVPMGLVPPSQQLVRRTHRAMDVLTAAEAVAVHYVGGKNTG